MSTGMHDPAARGQGELAFAIIEWLLWPDRVAAGWKVSNQLPTRDDTWGVLSHALRSRLAQRNRDMRSDDIDAACFALDVTCAYIRDGGDSPLGWLYGQCLAEHDIRLDFIGGRPAVSPRAASFLSWRALIDRIDPDALACLLLADKVHLTGDMAQAEAMIARWPLVINSGDRDLAELGRRGMTDLHIHFTSLWPVALSWQRVLRHATDSAEGKRPDSLPALHAAGVPQTVRDCIKNVCDWASLPALSRLRPPDVPFFTAIDAGEIIPAAVGDVLRPERVMLLRAWHAILACAPGWRQIEVELDAYIVGKSLFRKLHAQPLNDTNKGLISFDRVRGANSKLGMFDRDEASGRRFSGRRFERNRSFLVQALTKGGALSKAEVRIAPPTVAPSRIAYTYRMTFLAIDKLLRKHANSSTPVDVRVALHFKRALAKQPSAAKRDSAAGRPSTMPLLRKLLEFDRDTAGFQDYRLRVARARASGNATEADVADSKAYARFSRFDLASPERGAGPWAIAPYVRLLRGDPDMLRDLGADAAAAYFPKWKRLHELGRAHLPLGGPAIRLTCHAGEDYYTLADGLHHIHSAIVDWRLVQGDALGHCLALGLDPAAQLEPMARVRVPAGVEIDSLVWLRSRMIALDLGTASLRHAMDDAIQEIARPVYGEALVEFEAAIGRHDTLVLLAEKVEKAGDPLLVPADLAATSLPTSRAHLAQHWTRSAGVLARRPADLVRCLDVFDVDVARLRAAPKIPASLHRKLVDLIRDIQKSLLDEVTAKGLTIETNPSSNLRMERVADPSMLPVWRMIQLATNPPRVTICTDNPGTYDADIETEYAMMHWALLKHLGESHRSAARAALERMCRDGHRLFDDFA